MARKLPLGFVEILRQVNAEGTLPFKHRMKEAWRRYKTQSKRYAMRKTVNPKVTKIQLQRYFEQTTGMLRQRLNETEKEFGVYDIKVSGKPGQYLQIVSWKESKLSEPSYNPRKKKGYHRCPGCGGLFRGKICPVCLNPSVTPRQRRFMGAELGRKRAGKRTVTGMTEKQLRKFARKNPKIICPHCSSRRTGKPKNIVLSKHGVYYCYDCGLKFTKKIKRKTERNPIAIYNPKIETRIPATNIAISYRRSSGDHIGKWFRHSFGNTVSMYGLDNGSIMLRSNQRKKLWGSVD